MKWLFLLSIATSVCFAESDMMSQLVSPSSNPSFRYSGNQFFSDYPSNFHEESINAYVPLLHSDERALGLTGRGSWLGLKDYSPSHYYNAELGLFYSRVWDTESKSRVGASVSVGSAADKPFFSWDEFNVGATAFYFLPTSPASSWFLGVNYSSNRPFLNSLPLPVITYTYAPSKELRAVLGVPIVSLFWAFTEKWSVNLFAVVPWAVKTELAYTFFGVTQSYLGFDFRQQVFTRAGREIKEERVYVDGKRLYLGFRSPVSRVVFCDLTFGYVFDRSIFESKSYFDNVPKQNVDAGWQLAWGVSARF